MMRLKFLFGSSSAHHFLTQHSHVDRLIGHTATFDCFFGHLYLTLIKIISCVVTLCLFKPISVISEGAC